MSKNSVTTALARKKFAKAHREGIPVPKIIKIGWGTGGYNEADKTVVLPTADLTQVIGEFFKNDIVSSEYADDGLTVIYHCSMKYNDDPQILNKELSSIGIYDEEGTLIAVKNFKAKTIDEDVKIDIDWREEF